MGILSVELAQKFIEKTVKNLDFNINVMNEKGVIIASKNLSRVGDFHEVAFNLLNGIMINGVIKKDDEEKYINTKAGVNMFIEYNQKKVGVICVTGNPDEVESFAGLVKTSMEAMLEYELQQENRRRKKNDIEQFLYYLLFEENIDIDIANNLANNIHVKDNLYRIAVVIRNHTGIENTELVKILKSVQGHSNLDLMTIARNDNIVLLKYIEEGADSEIIDYKEVLSDYFEQVFQCIQKPYTKENLAIFVGTLQRKLSRYRSSYTNAQVLCQHLNIKNGIHFFNDHILDYFRSMITKKEYDDLFSIYKTKFNESDQLMVAETVETLSKNNYNVVNSAKDLFIHRNTLVFRLNKIKTVLHIDPIASARDREFLNELAYYFRQHT